jgi:mRNA interferase MazF
MAIDQTAPINPGDIFWITLPGNRGSEQSGRRPCVVVSRRHVNTGRTVVIVPLTTNTDRAGSFRVFIPLGEIIKDVTCQSEIKDSVALCHQIRVADRQFFESRIGKLSQNALLAVQLGLAFLFDIR